MNYKSHAIFNVGEKKESDKAVWNSPYSKSEIEFLKKATHVSYSTRYAQMALLTFKNCQVMIIKGCTYLIADRYFIVNRKAKERYRVHKFSWKTI